MKDVNQMKAYLEQIDFDQIKLFGTDLDGTFVNGDEVVPEVNIRSFRHFDENQRIKKAILTGRQYFTSAYLAKETRCHYLGTENGAVLFYWDKSTRKYEVLNFVPISFELSCRVMAQVEALRNRGVPVICHVSTTKAFLVKKGLLDKAWPVFYPQERLVDRKTRVMEFSDFAFDMTQQGLAKEIVKICIVFDKNQIIEAGKFSVFLRELGLQFWETSPGKFEIAGVGSGKVAAMKRIIRHETRKGNIILPKQVLYFGDNWNDEALLRFCRGCLVDNAPGDLKAVMAKSKDIYFIGPSKNGSVGETIMILARRSKQSIGSGLRLVDN